MSSINLATLEKVEANDARHLGISEHDVAKFNIKSLEYKSKDAYI